MDALILAEPRVRMDTADSFLVVSWWQDKSGNGHEGKYEYEAHNDIRDAEKAYDEYERGEYARARPVAILAVKNGIPFGRLL